MVARYEYEYFEDSINNQFNKLFWFSWLATEIIKYFLLKGLLFSLTVHTKFFSMKSEHHISEGSPCGKSIMTKQKEKIL